jgi:predicted transcriptional regulator
MKLKTVTKSLLLNMQIRKDMDINTERALLIRELQQVEDISLLKAIKAVLHYGLKSEGRISIEQYNRELDEAEARIEKGEFFTQEEVKKMAKGW